MYEAEQTKAEQRGAKRGRKPVKPLSPSSSSEDENMEDDGVMRPVRRLAKTTVIGSSDRQVSPQLEQF